MSLINYTYIISHHALASCELHCWDLFDLYAINVRSYPPLQYVQTCTNAYMYIQLLMQTFDHFVRRF